MATPFEKNDKIETEIDSQTEIHNMLHADTNVKYAKIFSDRLF